MKLCKSLIRLAATGILVVSADVVLASGQRPCTVFPLVIGTTYSALLRDFDVVAVARVEKFFEGGVERPNEGTYHLMPIRFFKGRGHSFTVPGTKPPTERPYWYENLTELHRRRAGEKFWPNSSAVVKVGTRCIVSAEMVLGEDYLIAVKRGEILGYEPISDVSTDQMIFDLQHAILRPAGARPN